MQIGEVIRKYRKEKGMTQEQVAEYLGVTAPAVNKWEKGSTYPDITLLPPLARLLNTDLNTLLCFREELTKQEIGVFLNEVLETIQKEGYEAGLAMVEEKIREYPTCDSLILSGAMSLEGALFMYPVSWTEEEKEPEAKANQENRRQQYRKRLEALYERAAESSDTEIRNQANRMLLNRCMERKEYEQAQKLIDTFPKNIADYQQMQAKLWIETGRKKEAEALLERQIMGEAVSIQGKLISLMELAEEDDEKERADFLAETAQKTAKLYGLTKASQYMAYYGLTNRRKEKKACIENLRRMLAGMAEPWNPNEFELYRHIHIDKKEEGENAMLSILPGMLAELKQDETLDFLRGEPEFQKLLEEFE